MIRSPLGSARQVAGPLGMGVPIAAAGNWWDPNGEGLCIWAAYQPKGAASFVPASLTDLSGNGNDAIDPGGANTPGWDAVNGWTFDGIAQYLETLFVAQNDQSQAVILQYTNWNSTTFRDYACGYQRASNARLGISGVWGGAFNYENGGVAGGSILNAGTSTGNLAVAGDAGYLDGNPDAGPIGPWILGPSSGLFIGARNALGVASAHAALYIQAFAIYDCAPTAPQMLAIAAAMAAV